MLLLLGTIAFPPATTLQAAKRADAVAKGPADRAPVSRRKQGRRYDIRSVKTRVAHPKYLWFDLNRLNTILFAAWLPDGVRRQYRGRFLGADGTIPNLAETVAQLRHLQTWAADPKTRWHRVPVKREHVLNLISGAIALGEQTQQQPSPSAGQRAVRMNVKLAPASQIADAAYQQAFAERVDRCYRAPQRTRQNFRYDPQTKLYWLYAGGYQLEDVGVGEGDAADGRHEPLHYKRGIPFRRLAEAFRMSDHIDDALYTDRVVLPLVVAEGDAICQRLTALCEMGGRAGAKVGVTARTRNSLKRRLRLFGEAVGGATWLRDKQLVELTSVVGQPLLDVDASSSVRTLVTRAVGLLKQRQADVQQMVDHTLRARVGPMRKLAGDRVDFLRGRTTALRAAFHKQVLSHYDDRPGQARRQAFAAALSELFEILQRAPEPDYMRVYPRIVELKRLYQRFETAHQEGTARASNRSRDEKRARNAEARRLYDVIERHLEKLPADVQYAADIYDTVKAYRVAFRERRLAEAAKADERVAVQKQGGRIGQAVLRPDDIAHQALREEAAKAQAFHQAFGGHLKAKGIDPASHEARHRWLRFYLSAHVPLQIDNPAGRRRPKNADGTFGRRPPRRVRNPEYKAFAVYLRMVELNELDHILRDPYLKLRLPAAIREAVQQKLADGRQRLFTTESETNEDVALPPTEVTSLQSGLIDAFSAGMHANYVPPKPDAPRREQRENSHFWRATALTNRPHKGLPPPHPR